MFHAHCNGKPAKPTRYSPTPCTLISAVETRVRGTSTKLNRGMAMTLTKGEISETSLKNNAVTGTSPRLMYHCTRATPATGRNAPCSAAREYSIRASCQSSATAIKDSQNEALSGAAGSHARTSKTAAERPLDMLTVRRPSSANCATASMISARCVGTVKPAKAAYRPAARRHANAATSALRVATATGMRNAIQQASKNIKPATSPTWSPDMATR